MEQVAISFVPSPEAGSNAGRGAWLGMYRSLDDAQDIQVAIQYAHDAHRLVQPWLGWAQGSREDPQIQTLSPRQRETLAYLLAGHGEKSIAFALGLSPHTVHNYVRHLHRVFGVSSRGELLARFVHNPLKDLVREPDADRSAD